MGDTGNDIEIIPLSAIEPDSRNANRHTERGTYMLNRSMERFGFLTGNQPGEGGSRPTRPLDQSEA
jgi:hypothetical protein